MIMLTIAQRTRYNAIFEPSKPRWSEAKIFEKKLEPIFGDKIFRYFLHSHNETRDLSYYFKNIILLTKFLTYLALEKEDDLVFHSFYHQIAAACVNFLKTSLPEQEKGKDKDFIYTAEFETLLHDTFFNSLCIKPGEMDRVKALFSTKCAIAASTQLIDIYKKSFRKENCLHFAEKPSVSRLPTRPSTEITRAIDAYKGEIQNIIQKILVTQTISLDSNSVNPRLQQIAYKLSRTTTAKISQYQLQEMSTYLSVLSFGLILTAFTAYQTGGDFTATALALSLSLLLIVFYIRWDDSLEKKAGEVSSLTQKIESDLARQEKELITQGVLEKQPYSIDTPKPSSDNPIRENEEAKKIKIDHAMWIFGFNELKPKQTLTSNRAYSSQDPGSQHQHPTFSPTAPLPVKKEKLPSHYTRDSSGRLIFFNPQEVTIIGKSQSHTTPEKFSQSTYFVHPKTLSDNLKGLGINDLIAFKLKPKARSNIRAYGIKVEQTINGRSEEVCVVTHFRTKAH